MYVRLVVGDEDAHQVSTFIHIGRIIIVFVVYCIRPGLYFCIPEWDQICSRPGLRTGVRKRMIDLGLLFLRLPYAIGRNEPVLYGVESSLGTVHGVEFTEDVCNVGFYRFNAYVQVA